jgi:hypothetical protein
MRNSIVVGLVATLLYGTASGQIFRLNADGFGRIDSFTTSGTKINSFASGNLTDARTIALDGAGHLFATWENSNGDYFIAEYTTSGALINRMLVSDSGEPFSSPWGLACDGNGGLYVANVNGYVSKYTTAGALVNRSFISGLSAPGLLTCDNNGHIFVATWPGLHGSVGEYTTDGATINSTLITSSDYIEGIATDNDGHLFVGYRAGTIAEYSTSGEVINPALITGLNSPNGGLRSIACDGNGHLFTLDGGGTIGEYTTSGEVINQSFIPRQIGDSGLFLAVTTVPEPTSFAFLLVGAVSIVTLRRGLTK